jgi:hypothetical protein
MKGIAMKAAHVSSTPPRAVTLTSTLDRRDWTREQWRLAYSMARAMIRQRDGHSLGASLTWFMDHAYRRFGCTAFRLVRAAGWTAFDRRLAHHAATGSREELARQGMLTRCVRLEPPRGYGYTFAWAYDPLAGMNSRRAERAWQVHQLHQARLQQRYVLTPKGGSCGAGRSR